jgi:hypothetical protein
LEAVADAAAALGEKVVSGDYSSATDHIYLPAVRAVVEVIAEDPRLTEEEKRVFLGSFAHLRWVSCTGSGPITRGSMMGNLCSFPLLCLLNKACHDIAAEEVYGRSSRRVGRFNGDDCCFPGNQEMYAKWRKVTSLFGLLVNESKTEFSARWIDLNSQTYDIARRNFVGKATLGFLRPKNNTPGEILTSVLNGVATLKLSVQEWIVNVVMRHEIRVKGFCFSNLSVYWRRSLVKRAWFRRLFWDGPATIQDNKLGAGSHGRISKESRKNKKNVDGLKVLDTQATVKVYADAMNKVTDREVKQSLGRPPIPEALRAVQELMASVSQSRVRFWRGRRVTPCVKRVDRVTFRVESKIKYEIPIPRTRYIGFRTEWTFLWPSEMLEWIEDKAPWLLLSDRACRSPRYRGSSPYLSLGFVLYGRRRNVQYPPLPLTVPPHLGYFPFLSRPRAVF